MVRVTLMVMPGCAVTLVITAVVLMMLPAIVHFPFWYGTRAAAAAATAAASTAASTAAAGGGVANRSTAAARQHLL